jgi:transposase
VLQEIQIAHSVEGFAQLDQARQRLGVDASECVIGIETSHSMLIDYLVEQGYKRIYILPPNAVKTAQGRYRQSGAKSDRRDARLIADILRVDHEKYAVWVPDSELTRQIRATVSLVDYLTQQIWQTGNRLRATLLRYYPAALELFSSLDSQISLAWIQSYPTPAAACAVSFDTFTDFAKAHHYPRPKQLTLCFARLQQSQPSAASAVTAVYAQEASLLAGLMLQQVQSKIGLLKDMQQKYQQHPDYPIYHSLPAAGEYLEPALLAKLGDDRQRFPSPQILQAVAGTCPVTKQSGKSHQVIFRRACDHEFRQIVQQWAKLSIPVSPWAAMYYQAVRPHAHSENEAYRKLANRWLEILWKLWQSKQPYDETKHLSAHARRMQPKA